MRTFLITCALLTVTIALSQSQIADIVFVNGKIWTVDRAKPEAEAVAVLGGRILSVGSTAELKKCIGPKTRVIDLKGKRMLPGFIDNHAHFMSGGFQLQSVDLRYTKNEAEFANVIRQRAEKHPDRWITGGDWDHDNWPGGNLPVKEFIRRINAQVQLNRELA